MSIFLFSNPGAGSLDHNAGFPIDLSTNTIFKSASEEYIKATEKGSFGNIDLLPVLPGAKRRMRDLMQDIYGKTQDPLHPLLLEQVDRLRGNPFLGDFASERRGSVLYVVDDPARARESEALLMVARALPACLREVRFRSVTATQRWLYTDDMMRRYLGNPGRSAAWSRPDDFVKEMINALKTFEPPDTLLHEDFDRGPVLIIGRPDVLFPTNDNLFSGGRARLHELLKKGGWPGRYHFLEPDTKRGDRMVRDRVTGLDYVAGRASRPDSQDNAESEVSEYDPLFAPSEVTNADETAPRSTAQNHADNRAHMIDYGVIFHTHVHGSVTQALTVVAGTSFLGTTAAALAITDSDFLGSLARAGLSVSDHPLEVLVRVAVAPQQFRARGIRASDISVVCITQGSSRRGEDIAAFMSLFRERQGAEDVATDLLERYHYLYEREECEREDERAADSSGSLQFLVKRCEWPPNEPLAPEMVPMTGGREVADVVEKIRVAANEDTPLLVTGESGTGKEMVARLVHFFRGKERPYIPVNCGALSPQLVESELFGHEKGAFNDATKRLGAIVAAGAGVVCLDEIGDLSFVHQVKLLRALEERKVKPIGADEEVDYQAKVVAMTNADLDAAVRAGSFRGDLYARLLSRDAISLPSLRDRRLDVPALIVNFFHRELPEINQVRIGFHALRVLLAEEYALSNVRTLLDEWLRGFVQECKREGLGQGGELTVQLADLPSEWRERAGMVAVQRDQEWVVFRHWESIERSPVDAARNRLIHSFRDDSLTAAEVLEVLGHLVEKVELPKEAPGVLSVLQDMGKQAKLRRDIIAKLKVSKLGGKEISQTDIAILAEVDKGTVSRWKEPEH